MKGVAEAPLGDAEAESARLICEIQEAHLGAIANLEAQLVAHSTVVYLHRTETGASYHTDILKCL